MHLAPLALLFMLVAPNPAGAADDDGLAAISPVAPASSRTGKERLSDKASDEQRVDDCKVPARRRTRERPIVPAYTVLVPATLMRSSRRPRVQCSGPHRSAADPPAARGV
jgi:hypothetical protein